MILIILNIPQSLTMIDYYGSIQRAIDFIEKHLTDPISIADVSRHAFQSHWYFQRIFRYVTGHSVYSYIRKRRLAEAGNDLFLTKDKVIDIALKYQYSTPESFLRSFQKEYGTTPLNYRKSTEHRLFERINVMDDRYAGRINNTHIRQQLVTRGEILFIGMKNRTTMQKKQNQIDVPCFWQQFQTSATASLIPHKVNQAAMGIYCNWDYDENFDVLTGCQVNRLTDIPKEMIGYKISAAKYMAFTVPGNTTEDLLYAWQYIYGVWMPNTGYERAFSDDFDMFDDRFTHPEKPESEIYIPIR